MASCIWTFQTHCDLSDMVISNSVTFLFLWPLESTPLMSLIESENFKKRNYELKDALFDKFAAEGIRIFQRWHLHSDHLPDTVFTEFVEKLFGSATIGDSGIVRRVHFEATTLLLADLKSQAASVDASEPVRNLPFVEKQSRLEKQKLRITAFCTNQISNQHIR